MTFLALDLVCGRVCRIASRETNQTIQRIQKYCLVGREHGTLTFCQWCALQAVCSLTELCQSFSCTFWRSSRYWYDV